MLQCSKTHQFPQIVRRCITVFTLCFSSSLLKVPLPESLVFSLIGQLTHVRPSDANNNRAKLILTCQLQGIDYATVWHSEEVWCHERPDSRRGVSGAVFSVGERSFCWCGPTRSFTCPRTKGKGKKRGGGRGHKRSPLNQNLGRWNTSVTNLYTNCQIVSVFSLQSITELAMIPS